MNIQARTYLYITTIIMAAATTAIASVILWPIFDNTTTHPALAAAVFLIATIAGRFPVRLSKQAQASLIKARPRAVAFNTAVNSLATGIEPKAGTWVDAQKHRYFAYIY